MLRSTVYHGSRSFFISLITCFNWCFTICFILCFSPCFYHVSYSSSRLLVHSISLFHSTTSSILSTILLTQVFVTSFRYIYQRMMSGSHQVALWLGLDGLRLQGLEEYSDSYPTSDYLEPILGSKCLVTQTMGDYLGLGPSEETTEKMFQVATRTSNLLYCFPFMYTHMSHFSG
jgi:hypothetical protein